MNRPPFEARGFFTVPDGTQLSAFLNATDSSQNDVPNIAGLANVSIAAGKISPKVHSWVHVHPFVTSITYVTAGSLTIRMKEPHIDEYDVALSVGQAAIIEPGTLSQLRNDGDEEAQVLYIVSPSYVYEAEPSKPPIYDDASMVAETWQGLREMNYEVQRGIDYAQLLKKREESIQRLTERK